MANLQLVMTVLAGLVLWMLAQEAGRAARALRGRPAPGHAGRSPRRTTGTPPARHPTHPWSQR
jgi:hypothetical protein